MRPRTGLALYRWTARESSRPVIRRYSSSFRLASSLLPRRARAPIASIYALVRLADEIVDGTASDAGADRAAQRTILDELERDTERALDIAFSANLVVQAFADVAREVGITSELTKPFFASMRRDLDRVDFELTEYRDYVHGSAEVVGLMCLQVFTAGRPTASERRAELEAGAIGLGAAFQKINFLRDLADDGGRLGRSYFPGVSGVLDEPAKRAIQAEIREDLRVARAGIALLPRDCRLAVATAAGLFTQLLTRIERTPADRLVERRISVPAPTKLALLAREGVRLLGRPA